MKLWNTDQQRWTICKQNAFSFWNFLGVDRSWTMRWQQSQEGKRWSAKSLLAELLKSMIMRTNRLRSKNLITFTGHTMHCRMHHRSSKSWQTRILWSKIQSMLVLLCCSKWYYALLDTILHSQANESVGPESLWQKVRENRFWWHSTSTTGSLHLRDRARATLPVARGLPEIWPLKELSHFQWLHF